MSCLRFTEEAMDKVRTYGAAVDEEYPGCEFSMVLLGPPADPDLCTEAVLLRGQKVSVADFEADEAGVEDTYATAAALFSRLVVRGIIHRHPGRAYHSGEDVRYIEGELLPFMATVMFFRGWAATQRWSFPLSAVRGADGTHRLRPEDDDCVEVELRPGGPEPSALPADIVAVHHGMDRVATVYSVVYPSRGEELFCVRMVFRSVPVPRGSGVQRVMQHERTEIPVRLVAAEEAGQPPAEVPSASAILTEVQEQVSRSRSIWGYEPGTYSQCKSSGGASSYGRSLGKKRTGAGHTGTGDDAEAGEHRSTRTAGNRGGLLGDLDEAERAVSSILAALPIGRQRSEVARRWDEVRHFLEARIYSLRTESMRSDRHAGTRRLI